MPGQAFVCVAAGDPPARVEAKIKAAGEPPAATQHYLIVMVSTCAPATT